MKLHQFSRLLKRYILDLTNIKEFISPLCRREVSDRACQSWYVIPLGESPQPQIFFIVTHNTFLFTRQYKSIHNVTFGKEHPLTVFYFNFLQSLVEWYVGRVGWASGDGLTCPGGSIANMYAMVMARHRKFPQLKTEGISGMPPLVVYTSDESHCVRCLFLMVQC